MKKEEILKLGLSGYLGESCLGCLECSDCYACVDCRECKDCRSCYECFDCHGCVGCRDCMSCTGLSDDRYMVDNTQLTESEYKDFMAR
jgi:hypothetical protein